MSFIANPDADVPELSITGRPELMVWWIPQIPMKPFTVACNSFVTAKALLTALAHYDLFQLANNIKPDFANSGGLMMRDEDGEYTDWTDEETGDNIDAISMEQCALLDKQGIVA